MQVCQYLSLSLFNRFACLAAVPDSAEGGGGKIVGAVDAAAMADANVLRCFPGTSEYLYISGMAVDNAYRCFI